MIRSHRSSFAAQSALCAALLLAPFMSAQNPYAPADTKPVLEPKTQAFIDAVSASGGKPIYTLPYAEARAVLENAQSGPITKLPVKTEDKTFPVGPTGSVSVRIYRPEGASKNLPVVMYFHGGGWVLGSANTHDRLLRDLVHGTSNAGTRAAFVFVNFTPSPEAQFPVPIEQAYAATAYVAEHGKELGLDSSRIAVAGDSVGGNMAAVVALLAKERKGPAIRYQALFYPVTDANFENASYNEFGNGPWLTKPAMEWFWNAYAPNKEDRKKITAAPLLATTEELTGLPPALVMTDENDVLRDEGEAYARKLTQAGVSVTSVRFLATFHDFALLNGLAGTPASVSAIRLASEQLAAALKQ
jgi:acetyl esterase